MGASGKLKVIEKDLGLTYSQGILYGRYGNYMVTFNQIGKELEFFTDARLASVSKEQSDALREFVKSNALSYRLLSFSMSSTGTTVTILAKDVTLLLDFVYVFMNELGARGIPGVSVCSNCGLPSNSRKIVRIGTHAHTCDAECAERLVAKCKGTLTRTLPQGGFVGFIGALLGCTAALIIYWLLGINGYYCAAAAFLIPIFASYGYSLLGGSRGIPKAVTVVLMPTLLFTAAVFVLFCLLVYRDWLAGGYIFTISELISETVKSFSADLLKTEFVYKQFLVGLLFIALGEIFALSDSFAKKELPRISELD